MVDDDLQRLRSWELMSWLYVPTVRSHRWAGAIECGARSRAVLDQWVQLWAEAGKAAADDAVVVVGRRRADDAAHLQIRAGEEGTRRLDGLRVALPVELCLAAVSES